MSDFTRAKDYERHRAGSGGRADVVTKLNWKPITEAAIDAAGVLGHTLDKFERKSGRSFKMASCTICYGCCWIAHETMRGFIVGGRLLKYRCGTPEAAGLPVAAEGQGR